MSLEHLPPPSPDAIVSANAPGRLRRAYDVARTRNDQQAVASLWLGLGALVSCTLALVASSSALYWLSLLSAIPAIVTARLTRLRGQEVGDADLVYLSRYGQVAGWIVLGLFILAVLFLAVFAGAILGSASS
jgi:hypothetical protein